MRIDLRDDNDVQGGTSRGQDLSNFAAESIPYLQEEELTLRQLFMARGFRTHDGYWGERTKPTASKSYSISGYRSTL